MKKIVSTIWLLLLLLSLNAQTIPADRRVNWKQALQGYSFKEPKQVVNILDFGGIADGKTDNSAALKQAMASFQQRDGTILFPAGTYLFNAPIVLSDSIQLKGEGADVSVLRFNLNHESTDCIRIIGTAENHFVSLKGGYSFGSTKLLSDSASYFRSGDWVEIIENNGSWNTVPAEWAKQSVGQMVKVKDVSGGVIVLEIPLRIGYQSMLNPRLQRITPISNVSVSCLKIVRVDKPTVGGGYNIFMDYAVNNRIVGVESDTSSGSHLYINRSAQIKVAGCYFHHAFAYDGASTHGYGITLAHHSGGCLVVNNIFAHLRHAMMVKTGANGNVFAYNYSRDPVRSEAISDLSGDISLHGHYPFANLFEGNIVQNIIIDHYWGPSGPMNTFFRNRAELWGIIMTQSDTTETSKQNFVGNECTNTSFLHGQFQLYGADNFVYANNILGVIIPDSSGELPDSSYYLSEKPDFWETNETWPDIGLPNELGTGVIPAKQRFENGGLLTVCPEPVTAVRKNFADDADWQIGPNPVHRILSVSVPSGIWKGDVFSVRVFDMYGKLLFIKKYQRRNILISLDGNFRSGVYILEINSPEGRFLKKIVLSK